jgi:hypothetical protein
MGWATGPAEWAAKASGSLNRLESNEWGLKGYTFPNPIFPPGEPAVTLLKPYPAHFTTLPSFQCLFLILLLCEASCYITTYSYSISFTYSTIDSILPIIDSLSRKSYIRPLFRSLGPFELDPTNLGSVSARIIATAVAAY